MTRSEWASYALIAIMCLGGLGMMAVGPLANVARKPSRQETAALRAEGNSIVGSLQEYERVHQRYPLGLPGSVDLSRGAKYGGWRYECVADCTRFELSVGRYGEHSFEIHWQPDKESWYVDM